MKLKKLFSSSICASVLTILGSLISFFNQVILANYFGATGEVDLYLSAISIPTFIAGIISTIFSYSLVPSIAKYEKYSDKQLIFIKSLSTTIFIIAMGICVVGLITVPLQIRTLKLNSINATIICGTMWLCAILQMLNAFLSSILIAFSKYYRPIVANIFPYVATITSTFLFHNLLGISSVSYGMFIGTLGTTIYFTLSNKKVLSKCKKSPFQWDDIIGFLTETPFVAIAMTCFSAYAVIDAYFAPQIGQASLSYLGYSQRMLIGVGNLVIAGPSSIIVPFFAEMVRNRNYVDFKKNAYKVLTLFAGSILVIAIIVSTCSKFIVTLLFYRGAFNDQAVLGVSKVFSIMVFGMLPMLCVVILFRIYYCLENKKPQMFAGILWSVCYISGSYYATIIQNVQLIAFSYVLSWGVTLIVTLILFNKSVNAKIQNNNKDYYD